MLRANNSKVNKSPVRRFWLDDSSGMVGAKGAARVMECSFLIESGRRSQRNGDFTQSVQFVNGQHQTRRSRGNARVSRNFTCSPEGDIFQDMLHIRLRIRMIVVVVAARNGTVGNGTGGTVAGGGLYNNAASVISSIAAFSG